MTEDEIFINSVKIAINNFPTIPNNNRCSECPIRFIDINSFSRNKINDKYAYLNKNAKYNGSTCSIRR